MQGFDLKNFPGFYVFSKTISGVFVLMGLLFLLDYYMPASERDETIRTSKIVGRDLNYDVYSVNTGGRDFRIEIEYQGIELKKDMMLKIQYSRIFHFIKGMHLASLPGLELKTVYNNIFLGNAFFIKILLLSVFALLHRRPKHWMVAITLINVPVIVGFTIVDKNDIQNLVLSAFLLAASVIGFIWYRKLSSQMT
jgi:hypothetical protein